MLVKSHFTDEIMETKPLVHFSESVLYHNRQVSHCFHSADEETEGPMAGESMCVGTRLLTYEQSKSTSTYFHCPDLQHSAHTACRVATEDTGGANNESELFVGPLFSVRTFWGWGF